MRSVKAVFRIVVVAAVMFFVCGGVIQAAYVEEAFTGSAAPDWTFVTAHGDGALLTGNDVIDDEGEGWLRLTITPDKHVSIEWKIEDGEWETLLDSFSCTLHCPSQIRFGFTASTGGTQQS